MYSNRARLTPSELMLRLDELDAVIRLPKANGSLDKAAALAMYIARSAPNGHVANLAMQVLSAALQLQINDQPLADGSLIKTLSQLRTALQKAKVS